MAVDAIGDRVTLSTTASTGTMIFPRSGGAGKAKQAHAALRRGYEETLWLQEDLGVESAINPKKS